ncbi:hypothetical protein A7M93_19575 [Acinetobacter baumannii]|nr:hypothetical protein A7M93_19575 [Acinetobacter baumannii]
MASFNNQAGTASAPKLVKMRSHLISLHPSIWEIVENGMHFDSTDNPMMINEQIHKNAQATIVLLASFCRDEYNKVSGLDNA